MAVTQIDLDDDALQTVMRIAGVHTKKDAVNYALREVAARERRLAGFRLARQRAAGWDHEGWTALREADKHAARG